MPISVSVNIQASLLTTHKPIYVHVSMYMYRVFFRIT